MGFPDRPDGGTSVGILGRVCDHRGARSVGNPVSVNSVSPGLTAQSPIALGQTKFGTSINGRRLPSRHDQQRTGLLRDPRCEVVPEHRAIKRRYEGELDAMLDDIGRNLDVAQPTEREMLERMLIKGLEP